MIVKRNFHPLKIWSYIQTPVLVLSAWATGVWALYHFLDWKALIIPFVPVGVLGSALAIFVAFRNNSAYQRWWEARKIWGTVVNSSRILARLVVTFTDSHAHQDNYNRERSEAFKRHVIYQVIGWVHALRFHLRGQNNWSELAGFFTPDEFAQVKAAQNKPNIIQLLIGRKIYEAMGNGTLGGFDSFQMEGQLAALANYQGAAERIKNTPMPRQYDFFTRVFVLLFGLTLPFGLLGLFSANPELAWLVIPITVVISTVFVIMERTGAVNEDPFENRITDVPITALSNTIERDLKEMLGEQDLPPKLMPEKGYLY